MTEILKFKKSNCKGCHKCIRSCPVKSIEFAHNQAQIIPHDCILCGQCTLVCPQNAKKVRNDVTEVLAAVGQGRRVVATVAPSFISSLPVDSLGQLAAMLRELGIAELRETAEGAHIVKREYERIIAEASQPVVISTCCHTVVSLVQKYYPELIRCLAPVISPMMASARLIKREQPDAYVVFIGPCISKKEEMIKLPGLVDCVLTFDELESWFAQKGVTPPEDAGAPIEARVSRFFPRRGGIIESMDTEGTGWQYIAVDGLPNCIDVLEELRGNRRPDLCFIEMSACEGSCINGPSSRGYGRAILRCHDRVDAFAQPEGAARDDFAVEAPVTVRRAIPAEAVHRPEPAPEEIQAVLDRMGKSRPERELNCGSCGYPTCRDKAKAVCNGRADINMCLPFLLERAESFSHNIFEISPNALFVLDDSLTIQRINASACMLFNLPSADSAIGTMIFELLDPADFEQVRETGNDIIEKRIELPELGRFVELSIVRDEPHQSFFAILKDITRDQRRREKFREYRDRTIEITDRVVEKQMRIVQEIASLLGETTAETKVALSQIRYTVQSEEQQ